jgi:multiple sugar transport system permease protein
MHIKGYQRDRLTGILLFLPMAIMVILLSFYPVMHVLRMSFYQQSLYSPDAVFCGLENFRQLFRHEAFGRALGNNLVFAFGSLAIQMVVGLGIALVLNSHFYARGPVRGTILFSYLVPYVVAALTFKFMLSDATGILSYLIRAFNLPMPPSPLGSKDWAMLTAIVVNSWKNFPFMVIVFLAQLQSISPEMYEAASVDGATTLQKFTKITFPLLLPTIVVVGMLRTIWNFNNFEVIFLLTQGGPLGRTETFPILIHRFVFGEFSMGRGSALAAVVLVILLAMSIIYWKLYENLVEKIT